MTTERCATLMAVGMANNLDEVWISENPVLLMVYLDQYFPNFFRWYVLMNYKVCFFGKIITITFVIIYTAMQEMGLLKTLSL